MAELLPAFDTFLPCRALLPPRSAVHLTTSARLRERALCVLNQLTVEVLVVEKRGAPGG